MSRVFIIAEAGVNHNGDLDLARRLVDAAAEAGADAVKFQTFKAERLASHLAPRAEYQKENLGADGAQDQVSMLRRLELDEAAHSELIACCRARGIEFMSTPFDHESIALLERLGIARYKIPSGEVNNLPYLRRIAALGKPVILSTGMCTMEEVHAAINALTSAGQDPRRLAILHCNSGYPTPDADVNLRAMQTLGRSLPGVAGVGYSDHTIGLEAAFAATALGAIIIEKHFTLDRSLPGPDHKISLLPHELTAMVTGIRRIETMLGSPDKRPTPSEIPNIAIARKSIVAARPIAAGEIFTEGNLTAKRPGTGLSPMLWDSVIGRPAPRNFEADELIEIE